MTCLLATHAFLWAASTNSRLSLVIRDLTEDAGNMPLVRMARLWELAITVHHLDIVSRLPLRRRDPLDLLMVAQCRAEGVAIVSNVTALDAHGIERLW